jgi:RNA polymerase sigma factor (sigma-70 family)
MRTDDATDLTLTELFALARRRLAVPLRRLLGNEADTDDVVQEACLRLWGKRRSLEVDNPAGLLYRTAQNLAIERLRQQKRRPSVDLDDPLAAELVEPVTPEQIVGGRQELGLALAALRNLPALHREALLLRYQGLTQAEIAGRLGISQSSASNYVARAIQALQQATEKN